MLADIVKLGANFGDLKLDNMSYDKDRMWLFDTYIYTPEDRKSLTQLIQPLFGQGKVNFPSLKSYFSDIAKGKRSELEALYRSVKLEKLFNAELEEAGFPSENVLNGYFESNDFKYLFLNLMHTYLQVTRMNVLAHLKVKGIPKEEVDGITGFAKSLESAGQNIQSEINKLGTSVSTASKGRANKMTNAMRDLLKYNEEQQKTAE